MAYPLFVFQIDFLKLSITDLEDGKTAWKSLSLLKSSYFFEEVKLKGLTSTLFGFQRITSSLLYYLKNDCQSLSSSLGHDFFLLLSARYTSWLACELIKNNRKETKLLISKNTAVGFACPTNKKTPPQSYLWKGFEMALLLLLCMLQKKVTGAATEPVISSSRDVQIRMLQNLLLHTADCYDGIIACCA